MMTLTGCLLLGAIVLTGNEATLTVGDNAEISSLKLKGGRELITERVPFAEAFLKDGRRVCAEKVKGKGEQWIEFSFPGGLGTCAFKVEPFEGGWTFTVAAVDVKDIEKLSFLRVKPNCDRIYGAQLCAFMDDEAGVVVRAYDPQLAPPDEHKKKPPVRERGLELLASEKYGMLGRRGGILAVPRAKVREGWKAMTLAAGVSHSKVGGAWALDDEGARGSYIFATWMDMASLDDWISLCEKAGVDILHFHAWWDTWGESDVSTNCFPRGLPDMRLAADRLRAAGIRCGMHTMTLSMQFGSSFLTPECSQELAYRHVYTLARDFRDGDDVLYVNEPIAPDQAKVLTGDSNGNILQLGGELVEYNDFVREKPYRFLGVKRGFMKTNVKRGGYAAGTAVKYPRHRFTAFFPDPDSPLADEVADRLAKVWKACGLCELFFDGSEGPREDYVIDALVAKLHAKLDRGKDGIYCCFSYNRPYNMWFRSYAGAWDYPTTGPKPFTDCHVAHYLRNSRVENLVGLDMGWWQPWRGGATSRGFYDDEMEYYAAKCAGADAAMSLHGFWRTSDHRLPFATESDTTRLGWWERARRARRFRAGLTERFAAPGADWRLKQDADGVWRVRPLAMTKQKVRGTDFAKWTVDSSEERPAELRVAALYAVDDAAAKTNALRLVDSSFLKDMVREAAPGVTVDGAAAANGNIRLTASNASAEPTAAWCCLKRTIGDPWLEVNRATTLWVKGDGSGATLNVQIRRTSSIFEGAIAEQYVKLDFTGWRKVGLLLRETDAEYADRFVWPYWDHHTQWSPAHLFRSLPLGRTVGAVSLYLNGIPKGGTVDVEVSPVDSVPEKATTLEKATVVVNGQATVLPFALKSGEYAELRDGAWTRFASNNEPLQRVATGERLALGKGDNAVAFYGWSGADEPRAEVTVTGVGAAEDAYTADFDYEAETLALYQPSAGFDAPVEARVHPNGRARLDLRIDGPIRNPSLMIGGETWTIPVALEASDRVFVKDGKWSATRVVAGANDGERRTKSSQRLPLGEGTLAKPLPVLSSGTTKIAIGADDPETCRARISVVKRYGK